MSGPIARSAVRRLVVLPLLLLSGCWSGDSFYASSDARPAIPAGLYRMSAAGDPSRPTFRVSIRTDGMTQFDRQGDGNQGVLGFAPLDGEGHLYALWETGGDSQESIYGLLRQEEDGSFLLHLPNCNDTVAIARSAGATVEALPLGIYECHFRDRASLEAALRQLHPDPNDPNGGAGRFSRVDHGTG